MRVKVEADSGNMKIFGVNIGKPVGPTTPTTEPVRTISTPMGTPVSRAFTVESGAMGDPMRHIMPVIDRLHGDGAIPALIAKNEEIDGLNGKFVAGRGILINPLSKIPEITTVHEIGHVLDFYGFIRGRYESLNGGEMTLVMDAWFASSPYRALQTLRAQLLAPFSDSASETRRQKELETVNYLLRADEVWSRAYAQWVATSSQDPILLQQLELLRQNASYSDLYVQWSDADFKRLSREIELMFKRQGWLR